jgi:hypothetical protein
MLAALTIVRLGGLRLGRMDPVLPPSFARFLFQLDPGLLIIPSVVTNGSDRRSAAEAIRFMRSDCIIVRISRRPHGSHTVLIDVGLMGREPFWLEEYRASLVNDVLYLTSTIQCCVPIFSLAGGTLRSVVAGDVPQRQQIEEGSALMDQLLASNLSEDTNES